jgi:hypothetical protein
MPFRSQAQWNWAFATDQEFAEEWARLTPGGKRRFELLRKRVAEKASIPDNPTLWKKAITQAKRKFDVYPSTYANAWAARWYKKRGGTWSTSKEMSHKHLPGKHDQRKHGRDGGSGSGSGGNVSSDTLPVEVDKLIEEYNAVERRGIFEARDYLSKGVIEDDAGGVVVISAEEYFHSRFGTLTPKDRSYYEKRRKPLIGNEITLTFSRNDEFEQINKQSLELVSNFSESQQMQLLKRNNVHMNIILAQIGTPRVRDMARQQLQGQQFIDNPEIILRGGRKITVKLSQNQRTPLDIATNSSIDYMADGDYNSFVRTFIKTYSSQTPKGLLGASLNVAVSQIGPNMGNPTITFYPEGVKPPEPHPKVIQYLNQLYDETQQRLTSESTVLYRTTSIQLGIPLESWTTSESTARRFLDEQYDDYFVLWKSSVDSRYILANHITHPYFVYAESEYLVLGTALNATNSDTELLDRKGP